MEANKNELTSEDLNSQMMAAEDHRHSHNHLEQAVKGENEEEIGSQFGDPEDRDPAETQVYVDDALSDIDNIRLQAQKKMQSIYDGLIKEGWTPEEAWDYFEPYVEEAVADAAVAEA